MSQLGQLKESAAEFKKHNAEVIAVFREDELEAKGLQEIKKKTKVDFTLLSDLGAKGTSRYSPAKREFDNYVIDSKGNIRKIIDGTLKVRAKSQQILEVLEEIEKEQNE